MHFDGKKWVFELIKVIERYLVVESQNKGYNRDQHNQFYLVKKRQKNFHDA